jgi:hypothetical protein
MEEKERVFTNIFLFAIGSTASSSFTVGWAWWGKHVRAFYIFT